MSDIEAILRWYLVLTLVSAAAAPLVAWLGAGLGASRYALLRPAGLAIGTAIVWWPALAFGLPFTRMVIVAMLIVGGLAGWIWWWRRGFDGLDLVAILAFEGIWLATFAGYALMRSYNPDIANTEKPMEIALLSAISRSSDVPAPDPWLAGFGINYYYFGYQSIATLVKLGGVPPVIAFNLGLATLFAGCATVMAGIGLYLSRLAGAKRWLQATCVAVAPVLLLLAGNLETARRLTRDFSQTVRAGWWDGIGWQASRIIVDTGVHGNPDPRQTINEFPAFAFVLGDLHPHVLTYPLLTTTLALAIGVATSEAGRGPARLAVIGGLVGLLYASNSWDAPAGLLFVLGGIVLAYRLRWRESLRAVAAVIVGAVLTALPFLLTFTAPVGVDNPDVPGWLDSIPVVGTLFETFGVVNWKPSSARELIIVHGLWIVACVVWLSLVAGRDRRTRVLVARHRDALLVAGSVSLGLAIVWMPAIVLLGWPIAASLWVAVVFPQQRDRVIAGLFAVGFLLALVPEFVYIQDIFADRMNTIFKLYFQAWLVLSVATIGAFARLVALATPGRRAIVLAGSMVWLAVALPYSPLSSWDWNNGFAERRGLDGSTYLGFYAPEDAALIAFIQKHAEPGDTLVEAPGCSYGSLGGAPLSRTSAFTGLPTLLGWQGHESQWRRGDSDKLRLLTTQPDGRIPRVDDANAILDGLQSSSIDGISPRFVVLGHQEVEANPNCSLSLERDAAVMLTALTDAGWVAVFESGSSRVFVRAEDPLVSSGTLALP